MARTERPVKGSDFNSEILVTLAKLANYTSKPPARWLYVDTARQEVFLVRESTILDHWPVSTSEAGLDNRENSGGTPAGIHRVARKIGTDAPIGTVFESREPTGDIWVPAWNDDPQRLGKDLILSRILVIDGLEPGLNQGLGIDSRQRYIYVHGTNRVDLIGRPAGGGCVRMENQDLIDLYEQIEEGDFLVFVFQW